MSEEEEKCILRNFDIGFLWMVKHALEISTIVKKILVQQLWQQT